ncbi:transglutaminase [Paenibacillus sp. 481]|nr:transglutaminase [Paenibacillus sp. 481]
MISASLIVGFAVLSTVEAKPLRQKQEIQQWLVEQLTHREPKSTFQYEGATDKLTKKMNSVLAESLHSDPFIRYNVSRYSFNWKGDDNSATVTVYVDYRETYEQSMYVRSEAKRIVQTIIKPEDDVNYKVKKIHDYIVQNVAYDANMKKFTAYEALTDGKTVCQGYALLVQAMMEEVGIPSLVIEGEAGNTLHAWNLIQMDERWYHLDATWNDPLPDKKNQVRYTYYMRTDQEMRTDHKWVADKYPQAFVSYAGQIEKLNQGSAATRALAAELQRVWSPYILRPDRAISTARDLVQQVEAARKQGLKQVQIRYAHNELQLRSDLHEVLKQFNAGKGELDYRVSAFNDSEHLLVDIELPAS